MQASPICIYIVSHDCCPVYSLPQEKYWTIYFLFCFENGFNRFCSNLKTVRSLSSSPTRATTEVLVRFLDWLDSWEGLLSTTTWEHSEYTDS